PLQKLKEKALRQIVTAIGIDAAAIKDFGSLKLLATLAQLASIAAETGLHFRDAAAEIAVRWSKDVKLDLLRPLFALNDLRQLGSHTPPSDFDVRLKNDLATFGVDVATITGGWGRGLDRIYDGVAESLDGIAALLRV